MGGRGWFWRPITPKVDWAGAAGSWWDGLVEEVKKGGLGCDVGLPAQRLCPLFVPNLLSFQGMEQDLCSLEHWPHWHVPALLSGAGLTVYSALWL